MSEPKRLLDGEGSDFERELLGSLAGEVPPRALTRRMRQGLVVAGLLTSAKTGIASFVVAGLVTVGAGTGWLAYRHYSAPAPVVTVSAQPPAAKVVAPPALSEPPRQAELPMPAASESPKPSAPPAPAPSAQGDLREEIAVLDRARAAVRAGDGKGALAALADYQRRFPRGTFAQEVTVLRIEALVQTGQTGGAQSLGKKFLAAHPESPHAERIERLLGKAR